MSILPSTHRALTVHTHHQPLELKTLPIPRPTPGSAIVRINLTSVISYTRQVLTGKRVYPYPTPFIPGFSAVGRIAALGPDATILAVGDLVLTDVFIHARDDDDVRCLQGLHQGGTAASAKLVENEWRDSSWAEYSKVPLENCYKLPEDGRELGDWMNLSRMLVPFGGMTTDGGLDLKVGETVVIAPATGQFGGAAVEVALAMGATVVALGRNEEALGKLKEGLKDYGGRLRTVAMTGDAEKDTAAIGPVEAYFDISPPMAAESTYIRSCFMALKPRGRVCLMGGIQADVAFPHGKIYRHNISIMGKWMYERNAPPRLIKMAGAGLLKLNRYEATTFGLVEWEKALVNAEEKPRWGQMTFFKP